MGQTAFPYQAVRGLPAGSILGNNTVNVGPSDNTSDSLERGHLLSSYTATAAVPQPVYNIEITLQLEVLANNKILVPGCEPTSAVSSVTLSTYLSKHGCGNALVDLNVALAAIPGSYVKLGVNFNRGNRRQKWFVLPPANTNCPCDQYVDWYDVLRKLANEELPVEENYDACDIVGMGYCPSPDFKDIQPPPDVPYREEGTFPPGVGVLPKVPSWGLSAQR